MVNISIFLFPLLVLIFGMLGGLITKKKIPTWYKFLIKPPLVPPNWLFPIVWPTLYIMIGISGYLIYSKIEFNNFINVWLIYFVQLSLNYLWTSLFFGWNVVFIAGIEIILLEICIIINCLVFFKIEFWAGILLMPYIVWVGFATYLNWGIYWLNRNKKAM